MRGTGSIITESLQEEINSIEPRAYRLGRGKIEADRCVSFLVRFMGYEESITGELFLRREEESGSSGTAVSVEPPAETGGSEGAEESAETTGSSGTKGSQFRWLLDDLILEEKRSLAEIRDSYRFDFSPYERFY